MILSRSTAVLAALLAVPAACSEEPEPGGDCLDFGGPTRCEDLLVRCARTRGVPPRALCDEACQAGGGQVFVCRGTADTLRVGLVSPSEIDPDQAAPVDLVVERLDCEVCEAWRPGEECTPGLSFCDPDQPEVVRACREDGRTSEAVETCVAGEVCVRPGCAPGAPCTAAAQCAGRVCDPGVIECGPPGEERTLVCGPKGEGRQTLVDCDLAGKSLRCGPEPVCVTDGGPPCDRDAACPAGHRCTSPGEQGGTRVCVPASGDGEPCLGPDGQVCAVDLRCVVEWGAGPAPGEGICRSVCDYTRNDCGQGWACLKGAGGGVCSSTVSPRHREECVTGLPAPCDQGVIVVGASAECVPVIQPAEAEVCDGVDNDCDGIVDNGYLDPATDRYDLDPRHCGRCGRTCGHGTLCEGGECVCPPGYADADGQAINGCECRITEGGGEVCDLRDNDCDGEVDEGFDADGDGSPGTEGCGEGVEPDCDDEDATVRPGATERCDGIDNDCDGRTDEAFDLAADPDHCGACGHSCRVPNALARCVEGFCPWECPVREDEPPDPRCTLECLPGALDDNDDPRDGCETTPCTRGDLPEPDVVGAYELGTTAPAALLWQELGTGLLATAPPEPDAPVLRPLSWDGAELTPGEDRPTAELSGGPFAPTGLAWADGRLGVLDGAGARILRLTPGEYLEVDVLDLPQAQSGALAGLAWDGVTWWLSDGAGCAVYRVVAGRGPVRMLSASGVVRGLDVIREEGLLLVSEPRRVCAYRLDGGVCSECWRTDRVLSSPGGLAWDGELWLLDPTAGMVVRTRLELPE